MVDEIVSLFSHLEINNEKDTRKRRLQMNATLDKNNSQRISIFRVK